LFGAFLIWVELFRGTKSLQILFGFFQLARSGTGRAYWFSHAIDKEFVADFEVG
jgi:hypothetical protein